MRIPARFKPNLLLNRRCLLTAASSMAPEVTRGCEFAHLVPDHILGDVDRHVSATIVYPDGMSNHLRENGRIARLGLKNSFLADSIHQFYFLQELWVNIGTLFQRPRHPGATSVLLLSLTCVV